MNKEHTDYLYNKYPYLTERHKLSMKETCMFWGFECGDGWFELLDNTFSKIVAVDPEDKYKIRLEQVKEKFGSLRVYYDLYDNEFHPAQLIVDDVMANKNIIRERKDSNNIMDEIDKIIEEAETISAETCENCGKTGKINESGWLSCLCDSCREKSRTSWTNK